MKQWLKKNWKWLVPCVVLLALGLTFYFLGFRITYAPELENNWDAISAVASWAGVLVSIVAVAVSGIAIWFAVQIPKKIADRQDKIAAFSLRISALKTVGEMLKKFERMRFYLDLISTECLKKQVEVAIDEIKTIEKTQADLIETLGTTYQFIFEPKTANKIKFIVDAINQIAKYTPSLEAAVDSIDFGHTLFEAQQREKTEADDKLIHAKEKMSELCERVLSLEKDISMEIRKYMDLRYV